MMKRAKDDTRSRDSGPGETPQRTDIFLERSKTVPIRLSVSASSNAQIFASATIPQKFKFLISDRMLLLFLAQAVLSACGGGGGGGGGDKPGPVFRGNTAPLPAETESTPPEPATEAESTPPEPAIEPVSVPPPVSPQKPSSVESQFPIANHSNRPVVRLVLPFDEALPVEAEDDKAESPWFFAILPDAPSPEADTIRFFLMAVAHSQDQVEFSLVMPEGEEATQSEDQSEDQSGRQPDFDTDLVELVSVTHNDPNVRAATLTFVDDAFDFESDRIRNRDGSPHFLVKVMATRSTNTKIKITEPMTLELKLLIANRNDTPLEWVGLDDVEVREGTADTRLDIRTVVKRDDAGWPVRYEIVDAAMRDIFEIDASTGHLVFITAPDYDAEDAVHQYNVKLRAFSKSTIAGDTTQNVEQTVQVTVTNPLDEPITVDAMTGLSVAENAIDDTQIGQLTATTSEAGNKIIRFEKTGGHAALGVADDGTITTTGRIDFDSLTSDEQANGIALTVRAVMRRGDETVTSDPLTTYIRVENRNDKPLSLAPTAEVTVAETILDTGHNVLATVNDAAGNDVVYAISGGVDADLFVIDASTGHLAFKTAPDHEAPSDQGENNIYEVEVKASSTSKVPGDATQTKTQTVQVTVRDVNDEQPVVTSGATAEVDENIAAHDHATQRGEAVIVYRAVASKDDAGPDLRWTLGGDAAAAFGINGAGEVWFRQSPDYEQKDTYSVTVTASSGGLGSMAKPVTVTITDIDEVPNGFVLDNARASLAETADTSARIKVADLTVTDPDTIPAFRQHGFSLSGTHADMFEVEGASLYLKAGAALDHETVSALDVAVTLDGTSLKTDYNLPITERFAVRVHDGQAFSNIVYITINIQGANDAPVATDLSSTFAGLQPGAAQDIDLAQHFSDPENDAIAMRSNRVLSRMACESLMDDLPATCCQPRLVTTPLPWWQRRMVTRLKKPSPSMLLISRRQHSHRPRLRHLNGHHRQGPRRSQTVALVVGKSLRAVMGWLTDSLSRLALPLVNQHQLLH